MKQAIFNTPLTRGAPNMAAALTYVTDTMFTPYNGDRSDTDDLVILITDGGSNDHVGTVTEALRLKAMGVHILVIAIGNWMNKYELGSIASYPESSNIVYISNYDRLSDIRSTFVSFMCGSKYPIISL